MEPFFFVRARDGRPTRFQRFSMISPLFRLVPGFVQELLRLQAGSVVTLMQSGLVLGTKQLPEIVSSDETVVRVSRVASRGSTSQQFQITANAPGSAWLSGKSAGSSTVAPLRVCVGNFKNQDGLTIDLIASACRSSDPTAILEFQRLLDNISDNLFNENSDANIDHWGQLACGTVAKVGGMQLLSRKTNYSYHTYHMPLKRVDNRSDVQYKPGIISKAAAAIKRQLKTGVPVLAGVVYDPSTSMLQGGELAVTRGGGHTVLIVGSDEKGEKFLYIDPYPESSKMQYQGGMAAYPFPVCNFLGTFEIGDLAGRTGILRQSAATVGVLGELEIVSGPKI
jgi:hypothetical protein